MTHVHSALILSLAAVLAGCQQNDPQSAPQAEFADPAPLDSASDTPVAGGMPVAVLSPASGTQAGIEIPRVSGIDAAAATRINAVLDREREDAVNAAEACRRQADGRAVDYELKAEETYNRNGLLSVRLEGMAICGGANGSYVGAAHSFDLATGEELDLFALTGLDREALGAMAASRYAGESECRTFLTENVGQNELVRVSDAYLASDGIGVRYSFTVGAAEGCARGDAVAPLAEARREGAFKPPLDRL